jgi:hypothetical protein
VLRLWFVFFLTIIEIPPLISHFRNMILNILYAFFFFFFWEITLIVVSFYYYCLSLLLSFFIIIILFIFYYYSYYYYSYSPLLFFFTSQTVHGTMKLAAPSKTYLIMYTFPGIPLYLPPPSGLTSTQTQWLSDLFSCVASNSNDVEKNSYVKKLSDRSMVMLQAYAYKETRSADTIRNNVKAQLVDWFIYDTQEKTQYYFTEYPDVCGGKSFFFFYFLSFFFFFYLFSFFTSFFFFF